MNVQVITVYFMDLTYREYLVEGNASLEEIQAHLSSVGVVRFISFVLREPLPAEIEAARETHKMIRHVEQKRLF